MEVPRISFQVLNMLILTFQSLQRSYCHLLVAARNRGDYIEYDNGSVFRITSTVIKIERTILEQNIGDLKGAPLHIHVYTHQTLFG